MRSILNGNAAENAAGADEFVEKDVRAVVEAAGGRLVKCILETAMLTDEEVERAIRYNYNMSIMFMDLDHFKNVNDIYGHDCGNFILHEIGKLLNNSSDNISILRKSDIAIRYVSYFSYFSFFSIFIILFYSFFFWTFWCTIRFLFYSFLYYILSFFFCFFNFF